MSIYRNPIDPNRFMQSNQPIPIGYNAPRANNAALSPRSAMPQQKQRGWFPNMSPTNRNLFKAAGMALASQRPGMFGPAAQQMNSRQQETDRSNATSRYFAKWFSDRKMPELAQMAANGAWKEASDIYKMQTSQAKKPTSVQEHEYGLKHPDYAKRQLMLKGLTGGGVKIKEDWTIDDSGRMVPRVGSEDWQKQQDTQKQNRAKVISEATTAANTLDTIGEIEKLFADTQDGDVPISGTLSVPAGKLSGTKAGKLRSYISHLQSTQALGTMARLKEMSSTGSTGFGALNKAELDLIIAEIGALDADKTDPEILQRTVNRIKKRWDGVLRNFQKEFSPEQLNQWGLGDIFDTAVSPSQNRERVWNPKTRRLE